MINPSKLRIEQKRTYIGDIFKKHYLAKPKVLYYDSRIIEKCLLRVLDEPVWYRWVEPGVSTEWIKNEYVVYTLYAFLNNEVPILNPKFFDYDLKFYKDFPRDHQRRIEEQELIMYELTFADWNEDLEGLFK